MSGTRARVVRVKSIEKHPDDTATNIEVLTMGNGITVVTGKHYVANQRGIYIPPGWLIPGYLAEDAWMVKKGREWVLVESRVIRGVPSPGIFLGETWRNDRATSPLQRWPLWRDRWVLDEDVTAYLGLVPESAASAVVPDGVLVKD